MYVCQCAVVTDREVIRAVDDGAETVEAVGNTTGAGTGCGMCKESIADILERRSVECPLVAFALA